MNQKINLTIKDKIQDLWHEMWSVTLKTVTLSNTIFKRYQYAMSLYVLEIIGIAKE